MTPATFTIWNLDAKKKKKKTGKLTRIAIKPTNLRYIKYPSVSPSSLFSRCVSLKASPLVFGIPLLLNFVLATDRYRSWARQSAWYDNEGEPSTHNPFKKFRANKRATNNTARQLEMGTLDRSVTEGNIESPAEIRRRIELSEGIIPLGHPDTWSQPSRSRELDLGDDNVSALASSQDPINRSLDDDSVNQPRRRKNTPNSEGGASASYKDIEDEPKPHFTVGGQLRATIFNSWINVLLVCVPAGSMSLFRSLIFFSLLTT